MYLIRFGRWSHAASRWLIWERVWWKGYKWTPFVKVRRRLSREEEVDRL